MKPNIHAQVNLSVHYVIRLSVMSAEVNEGEVVSTISVPMVLVNVHHPYDLWLVHLSAGRLNF